MVTLCKFAIFWSIMIYSPTMEKEIEEIKAIIDECKKETEKRIVGQSQLITDILTAFVAGGHVLLEGVPGLAKTLTVKTIAEILGLDFKRIQFTPDLLPADVTGTLIYEQKTGNFTVRKGPVFANVILADEINRAPAKVQSAMLEAMEEKQVTIGEETFILPKPFFVLATQNPVEQEGTYNLPEAELDRFLLKLIINYPSNEDEKEIIKTCGNAPSVKVKKVLSLQDIEKMQAAAAKIVCDDKLVEYIVSILNVTRRSASLHQNTAIASANDITRYISFGASPRAGIAIIQCAKIHALFEGRSFVLPEDIKAVTHNVLRHRLVLSYEAAADNISADEIISRILEIIPLP